MRSHSFVRFKSDMGPPVLFLADELGDFTAELKMSLFQLGISPQIIASIIMQVYCLASAS